MELFYFISLNDEGYSIIGRMIRSKTVRRGRKTSSESADVVTQEPITDSVPTEEQGGRREAPVDALESKVHETQFEKNIQNFFVAESAAMSVQKPWLRLERGIRLQKYRTYAQSYPGLTTDEQENLYKVLMKANDAKLLNTKQQINYENGIISAIKNLKVVKNGDPSLPAVFKIEIPRPTKKNIDELPKLAAAL